ncbi:hypothetical protein ACFX1Q_034276 [Malus domestica]
MLDIIAAIHALGETQKEIVAFVKELKNLIPKPIEKTMIAMLEKAYQDELVVAVSKGLEKTPSFVTQEDVIAMLENELHMSSKDWKYVPEPPYPTSVLHIPYPKGYKTPNLVFFDGNNGSPEEHISRFIDVLGPHVGEYNLRLREFSKSLINRAYTWYTTLALGSIGTWEELADLALDCCDKKDEKALVEICISNIVADYKVYLENIGISQFSRLLEAVWKTSLLVKPSTRRSWKTDKKEAHHALAVDNRSNYNSQKMMKRESDREPYHPLASSDEKFPNILDTMLAYGAIKLPRPYTTPSREDRKNPSYCRYHQYVGHPYIVCQTLRKILHVKICEGTLKLPCKTQAIDIDPLPKR